MSLKVKNLNLNSWRSFKDYSLELSPDITVLVGPNAVGKTNTIEALQYLTAATSFRKPTPSELVLEGEESACIKAQLEGDGRLLDVEMDIKDNKRQFFLNNKKVQASKFSGNLFSILFNPDDLLLVKGSASKRRDELDNFGIQIHAGYRKIYNGYTRSIEQRNHLLKDGISGVYLDSWDEAVAQAAAILFEQRIKMFNKLSVYINEIYNQIIPSEKISSLYIPSFNKDNDLEDVASSIDKYLSYSRDELTHFIEKKLYSNRDEDLRRGQTCLGPHRDDVMFFINNKDSRKYGSQGQQRSVVLAWKLAEVKLCNDFFNSCPILLLDDVMSELDETRRSCITQFINSDIQTVITTTNLGYFTDKQLANAKVVQYG